MIHNLPVLNLIAFQPALRLNNNSFEIFDYLRKKWVKLTPEEWVRQSFVHHLVKELGYPQGRIGIEFQVKYNSLIRRVDAVVFDDNGRPLVIIECKAHTVEINEDVFYQACMYNRQLKAKWLFLTNGLIHIASDISGQQVQFQEQLPRYDQIV